MKFKKNDQVYVIAGRSKGKNGTIQSVNHKDQTVIIKDINMVTKHNKPTQQNTEGSISSKEAAIHVSNVAFLVKKPAKNSPAQYSKIGFKIKDGKKVRVAKKTKKEI
nr:50S ribosomal protein L24 [Mycoplasma crocodyli]